MINFISNSSSNKVENSKHDFKNIQMIDSKSKEKESNSKDDVGIILIHHGKSIIKFEFEKSLNYTVQAVKLKLKEHFDYKIQELNRFSLSYDGKLLSNNDELIYNKENIMKLNLEINKPEEMEQLDFCL